MRRRLLLLVAVLALVGLGVLAAPHLLHRLASSGAAAAASSTTPPPGGGLAVPDTGGGPAPR